MLEPRIHIQIDIIIIIIVHDDALFSCIVEKSK